MADFFRRNLKNMGVAVILAAYAQHEWFGGLPNSVLTWAELCFGWALGLVAYYGAYELWKGRNG